MAVIRSSRARRSRRLSRRAPARRIGPAQARLVAALALPLGVALLARMAGLPLLGSLAALALLAAGAAHALAQRPPLMPFASAPNLNALTPLEFECYVAAWFRAWGYRVEHVGGRGDGGVDVRVWRGGRAGIVQCKRYGSAHPVGPAVIRELVGTRTLHGLDYAWLATTGRVTAGARQLALAERIGLVDAVTLGASPPHLPI
jgi:hypothetical protein